MGAQSRGNRTVLPNSTHRTDENVLPGLFPVQATRLALVGPREAATGPAQSHFKEI
jgi:hypothetical protein